MAIYGFGARYNEVDVSDAFVEQGVACIGWSEEYSPSLHQMLQNIKNGDLVFIKSQNPTVGLIIKAVGIVTNREVKKIRKLGKGVAIHWVCSDLNDRRGPINDAYIRTGSLFEEHNPEIQKRVINYLLNGAGKKKPGPNTKK